MSKIEKPKVDSRIKRAPVSPPIYRPQPVPHVLQTKSSRVQPRTLARDPITLRSKTVQLAEQLPAAPASTKRKLGDGATPEEAARRAARRERFAPELKAQADEKNQKDEEIESLRSEVEYFSHLRNQRKIRFESNDAARKHGDRDPVKTFQDAFAVADFPDMNVWREGEELIIGVKVGGNRTVTGAFSYRTRTFKIFHSGPTQAGQGYGVSLGKS